MYYVYVIRSGKRRHIGYTRDLRRRMEEHNRGENKSTRGRKLKQRGRSRQILYERIKRSMS